MKLPKLIILFLVSVLAISRASGQANATLNILTSNSGMVNLGETVDIQVTVGNTGPVSSIGANKVRSQISIPTAIASALATVDQTGLPAGWTITVNTGGAITVCNGSDVIPVGAQRQVFIKVHGTGIGGPSTVNGALLFSNGASCTIPGTLAGDNAADNTSTSSIQVVAITTPVTLTDFDAVLLNCKPVLRWVTETEINSDRFDIERGDQHNTGWTSIGIVAAMGNSSTRAEYNFTDINLNGASDQVLYRLKMIDKDGKYKYSKVLRIFTNCNTTRVNVYPNPVQDGWLYVSLTGTTGYAEANLLSLSGQVLLKNKMNNGTNHLNVTNIADGVYVLNIKSANGVDKKIKVFIQH